MGWLEAVFSCGGSDARTRVTLVQFINRQLNARKHAERYLSSDRGAVIRFLLPSSEFPLFFCIIFFRFFQMCTLQHRRCSLIPARSPTLKAFANSSPGLRFGYPGTKAP